MPDDSDWRSLDLPHDWAVEGPFDPDANLSQGYRNRGVGWYRRHFKLDPSDRGKHLELQFDGVATHCTVWVNGTLVHRNWCGYTSFYIDITPFAKYGDDLNTIAVRVDADPMEGWWYEGAGIYRHTWLVKRDPVHVATDGVYCNPVKDADGAWTVPIEVTLESCAKDAAKVDVDSTLLDPTGREVAKASATVDVNPLEESVAKLAIPVAAPQLWSVDSSHVVRTANHRAARRQSGRQCYDALRLSYNSLRRRPRLLSQRSTAQAKRRVQSPRPRRSGCGGSRFAVGFPHSSAQGDGRQCLSMCSQSTDRRVPRRLRPPGHAGHGRKSKLQHCARIHALSRMDGAPRPQSSKRHPLVGVQRGADAGNRAGLRNGAPHDEGGEVVRHDTPGHGGPKRLDCSTPSMLLRRRTSPASTISKANTTATTPPIRANR